MLEEHEKSFKNVTVFYEFTGIINDKFLTNQSARSMSVVLKIPLTCYYRTISFPGFTVDKLDTYGPAFYMAGGALIAASLTPCVLCCIRDRKTERTEVSLTISTQELKEHSCCNEPGCENKTPRDAFRSKLFVSTV